MKIMKTLAALGLASAFVMGCGDKQSTGNTTPPPANKPADSNAAPADPGKQPAPTDGKKMTPDQGDPCHSM